MDLIQDKHTGDRKKLFQMGKAVEKFELNKLATVTMNTSFEDATLRQRQKAKLPQLKLPILTGNFIERLAFNNQFGLAENCQTDND